MSKIAKEITQKLMDLAWANPLVSRENFEAAIDAVLAPKTIKKSEYERLHGVDLEADWLADELIESQDRELALRQDQINQKLDAMYHYEKSEALKSRLWETERELAEAKKHISSLGEQVEQKEVQLAGVTAAALGWNSNPVTKGQWAWSVAYQDTLELRLKYDAARTQNSQLWKALAEQDLAVEIAPPACLKPLDSLSYVNVIIQNDGLERITA